MSQYFMYNTSRLILFVYCLIFCIVDGEYSKNETENSSRQTTSVNHLEKLKYKYNLHTTKKQGAVKGIQSF